MKKPKVRWTWLPESLLVVLATVLAALPRWIQLRLGEALGACIQWIGYRRQVVEENLERAYPGPTQAPHRARILRESYQSFGKLLVEFLSMLSLPPWDHRRNSERRTRISGFQHWERAQALGRGVLMLTSHRGNWELMSACACLSGMKALMVTKHLKPEWLHRRLEKVRRSAEVRGTYEPRTLKDVLKELSQGGTVGFVLDQYAGPPVGIRVPFFGVPVGTQTAVAILAKRTGAAVLPIRNHRTKDGVIEIRIDPPVPWVEAGDQTLAVMTAKYTEILEEHIREVPGQWLWVHRRFKGDLSPLRREEWSEARPKR